MAEPSEYSDAVETYRTRHNVYESYARRLKSLIIDLLQNNEIDFIQVESRTKTVDSFEDKLVRKGAKYKNPLSDITDLVGIRVITYYQEDVERIGALLKAEFDIDDELSVDKSTVLQPNEFGYASNHYVASLSEKRASLTEWAQWAGIVAEIQVRTSLQHSWAAVSHKLSYKTTIDAPATLQRRLFRLSALFELADQEFSSITIAQKKLADQRAEEVRRGDLSAKLDAESLDAYLDSKFEDDIRNVARTGEWWHGDEVITDFSPVESRSALLELLNSLSIGTVEELNRLIGDDVQADIRTLSDQLWSANIGARDIYDVFHALVLLHSARYPPIHNYAYYDRYIEAIASARAIRGYGIRGPA